MAYDPITSWQMDGETMETVRDLIFLGSKTAADGDFSHEIKTMTNDGSGRFPEGLEDVSTYPVLIEELLRRGWREEELQGVLRGNLLRVFRQVEQVSWAGQKQGSVV